MRFVFVCLLSLYVLSACGGGGGGSDPDAPSFMPITDADIDRTDVFITEIFAMPLNDSNPGFTARWTGQMMGEWGTDEFSDDIIGDTTIVFDLANSQVDIVFDNIRGERDSTYGRWQMLNIPVTNGSFEERRGETISVADLDNGIQRHSVISGSFRGPNHEGITGYHRSRTNEGLHSGADVIFGARRQ